MTDGRRREPMGAAVDAALHDEPVFAARRPEGLGVRIQRRARHARPERREGALARHRRSTSALEGTAAGPEVTRQVDAPST
jgi:hypothetical protein